MNSQLFLLEVQFRNKPTDKRAQNVEIYMNLNSLFVSKEYQMNVCPGVSL